MFRTYSHFFEKKMSFLSFANNKCILLQMQRDPRLNEILFPEYDKKWATRLIQSYETDLEYVAKSKFCCFEDYQMSH